MLRLPELVAVPDVRPLVRPGEWGVLSNRLKPAGVELENLERIHGAASRRIGTSVAGGSGDAAGRSASTISAVLAAGALSVAAATSAQATAPTVATGHGRCASVRTGVAPAPTYSKGFTVQNQLGATTMMLADASGNNEGLPTIGSTMQPNDTQRFEVQYVAAGKGVVDATYDILDPYRGNTLLGTVVIEMTYDWDGCTSMRIKDRRGSIVGWNLIVVFPYTSTDAWLEVGPR